MSEAVSEGHQAHGGGMPYSSNPYSIYVSADFGKAMDWAKGWRAANTERVAEMVRAFNAAYTLNANRRGQYDSAINGAQ